LVFALVSGVKANALLAGLALVVGLLVGIVRGFGTRLYRRNGQVAGRHSLLFLLGWGLSYALVAALNLLGSALVSAVGLLGLCLSTGTQIGLNGWLLIRCLMLQPRTAPPSSLPERG
jgi:F0F1-type ATP synthase membrane subunit c/vacuolar-type H+-ATPase subunit K